VILFSFLAAHERAQEAGAAFFLLKPVSDERLLSVVDSVLHSQQHSTEKDTG
jgi:FixJ family two-component response regulator